MHAVLPESGSPRRPIMRQYFPPIKARTSSIPRTALGGNRGSVLRGHQDRSVMRWAGIAAESRLVTRDPLGTFVRLIIQEAKTCLGNRAIVIQASSFAHIVR